MRSADQPQTVWPVPHSGADDPDGGCRGPSGGGSVLRVLVSVDSLERARSALATAARLADSGEVRVRVVHVRMWDPMPRTGGRFFLESGLEATAIVDGALGWVWRAGLVASGVVVDAPRSKMAGAVLGEAAGWAADAIVVTVCPRRFPSLGRGVWDRVSRQVLEQSTVPVLTVHPEAS